MMISIRKNTVVMEVVAVVTTGVEDQEVGLPCVLVAPHLVALCLTKVRFLF